jgi:hypothetical protein
MNPIPEGVRLFNAAQFWEAHEAWEARWLDADGDEKLFLQGLIQLAAAYHHVQRGTLRGGLRLFASSREKLHKFRDGFLSVHFEEAVVTALGQAERLRKGERISPDEWPKLRYNRDLSDPGHGPPSSRG